MNMSILNSIRLLKKRVAKKKSGSPKLFRRKKRDLHKSTSMSTGLAQLALSTTYQITATTGVGGYGVEDIIKQTIRQGTSHNMDKDDLAVMKYVEDNIIGKDLVYESPFGKRAVIYCDYTASGKAVRFIEDYIRDEVLPFYGNTHTTTTVSSLQTSMLRAEAKQIIRKSTNATEDDVVIFVSSGCTGAILKLIHAMDFKEAPVVFVSPFEHHSNLLPWLEMGAEVVYGEENSIGTLDLETLEEQLKKHKARGKILVGSFSAASNITGIINDTEKIATLMHQYDGYAFFDYATAGPYLDMNMNPHKTDVRKNELSYKDAVFCSVHKFVGGPGTPGLLVAKRNLFQNPIPDGAGGGTVLFVTHKKHHYLDNIEEREEGGTPAIVESIRAGLVFQLKEEVTSKRILNQEHIFVKKAYKKWGAIKTIHILGPSSAERLPIFALVIEFKDTKRMLHHNYISSLLNDLFGIQARGGCACAGPYAEDLLGIDMATAEGITDALLGHYNSWKGEISDEDLQKVEGKIFSSLKPGFARLNLPYFMDSETIEFILEAVAFVAKNGWKFLPMYEMNPETGDFTHKESRALVYARRLTDVKHLVKNNHKKSKQLNPISFKETLKFAETQAKNIENEVKTDGLIPDDRFLPESMDKKMRWFLLPSEAHAIMRGENPYKNNNNYTPMFYPRSDDALKGHNKLNRTRLKSGLANVKFCNCPRQMHRHVKNRDCIPEQKRGSAMENKENRPDLDSEKTIVYDLDDKMNVVAPLQMKSNGQLSSKPTNGHISNGNGHLPGQVWDLDIEKS
ncbi:uncharacterized protein [Clytia hemisphaerica]|uniref:uncharacterized protein isoform X4 n=1 Tax=Clytia hemisphaerica TaxID=252671 RepID=UPI0034D4F758